MKNQIICCFVIFFVSIILILVFDNYIDFNLFSSKQIKIPETFVDKITGEEMKLNKNTDKKNPLKIKNIKKKVTTDNHRNLVFTSAGDKTKFHELWTGKNQSYDVMVVYYGKNEKNYDKYASKVDYIMKQKGSKFQNFHYVYENYPEIIDKYDRFFILDDDIIFNVDDINNMFKISKKYKLDICGPTFKKSKDCKISHLITKTQNKNQIRYTNFIEVNVPLFNRNALDNLMKYYDPILLGWGIDYLYIWANGQNKKKNYALVDFVQCINPTDDKKGGNRELNNISRVNERAADYAAYAKKIGLKEVQNKTWSKVQVNIDEL